MLSQAEVRNLRRDIPALQQINPRNGKPPLYLDSSCVTLQAEPVIRAMVEYATRHPGCGAHRSKHWFARLTEEKMQDSRRQIAQLLGVPPAQGPDGETYPIIFTRNTTESLNVVASSVGLMPGDAVVLSNKEHNSNLCPWQEFERRGGRIHYVHCGEENTFDAKAFIDAVAADRTVKMVALHHSSNLDGVSTPLAAIVAGVREVEREQGRNVFIVVDGAQAAPHLRLNLGLPDLPGHLDVDFYAGSFHKMLGPSGIGFLYGKAECLDCMNPFLVGGSTIFETSAYHRPVYAGWPERFEAGLQNYAGIHGAGAASQYLGQVVDEIRAYEIHLNRCMTEVLLPLHRAEKLKIIGPVDGDERGGVLTFLVSEPADGPRVQRFEARSEEENLMCRTGQFCVDVWFSTQKGRLPRRFTAIRFSAYVYNTIEEVETAARVVAEAFS